MELQSSDIEQLSEILKVCKLAGIETLAINKGIISGLSESQNAAIIQKMDFSFGGDVSIGIQSTSELAKRFNVNGVKVLAALDLKMPEQAAKNISFATNNSKLTYRFCSIKSLVYAKENNDTDAAVIEFSPVEIKSIITGVNSLSSNKYLYVSVERNGTVSISTTDDNNDIFELKLAKPISVIGDGKYSYSQKFDVKGKLLPLLSHLAKDDERVPLIITENENLKVVINEIEVILIPAITSDD
jgi:hypothetical protein